MASDDVNHTSPLLPCPLRSLMSIPQSQTLAHVAVSFSLYLKTGRLLITHAFIDSLSPFLPHPLRPLTSIPRSQTLAHVVSFSFTLYIGWLVI